MSSLKNASGVIQEIRQKVRRDILVLAAPKSTHGLLFNAYIITAPKAKADAV